MYAAVAKELGLTTDAVKAAFEANRPAKPAKVTPDPRSERPALRGAGRLSR